MDQPATPLVPVQYAASGDVVKVNDTINRSGRTLQNSVSVAVIVGLINRYTGLDLTAEEALVILPFLIGAASFLRNLGEYRGWIPSTKKTAAEIAPPKNAEGQTLATVKQNP